MYAASEPTTADTTADDSKTTVISIGTYYTTRRCRPANLVAPTPCSASASTDADLVIQASVAH
jgi:hypothetical protein